MNMNHFALAAAYHQTHFFGMLVVALVLGATLVVAVGRGLITASLAASAYKYVGWGTGAGTAADSDTTLFTEVTDTSRATGTQSQQTTTTTNDTYRVVGTITATQARAITNAGVFDQAATGGNMFSKGDFSTINLNTGDSIQFTFNHKFA